MRKDERLRTVYETIAPYITRTEGAWRDYLKFAALFYKYSFDNALLVYAQNPNVTMLATTPTWNKLGRYINKGATGLAVCEYDNARLTLKHLFDISQTNGREIIPTNWQLDDKMKTELTGRFSYAHNLTSSGFAECMNQLAEEAVSERLDDYLQDFDFNIEGHLFSQLPQDGLLSQMQEIVKDSVTYFIGKRCSLADDEIHTSDGMTTIAHFDTLPLIARLGYTVTDISKGILLEVERTIKIIEQERRVTHEQNRYELHREGRSAAPEPSNLQQQRGRQPAPGQIRQDGDGILARKPSAAVYDFENGWHNDGENAPGPQGSGGENRAYHPADAGGRTDAGNGGHHGEDPPREQPTVSSGGNRAERDRIQGEVSPPSPSNQNAEPPESELESPPDGSFFVLKTQNLQERWADRVSEKVLPIPIEEGVPTPEKVAAVREWLQKNSDIYHPVYTVMYHATSSKLPILEEGLLPTSEARRRSYQSTSGYVYLANTPERAKNFGDLGNMSDSTVYEVIIPVHKLLADIDQLNNQKAAGKQVGNSLAESIVYGGGARVKGAIAPWQIKAFDYEAYRKSKYEATKQAEQKASYINIEYTDEQVREYYESILKSTDLYSVEMYEKIQALFSTDMPLEDKAVALSKIYEDYGNAEYQADVLLKTVHRGENGMSFYFGDGYTHIPWHTIAHIIEILIREGEYPAPILEESLADKIGDFNIPDEIDEMHIADGDISPIAHEKEEPDEQELYACVDSYLCNTQIVYKGWHGEIAVELANGKIDEYLLVDYFRDLDERETQIGNRVVTCAVEDNGVEFMIDHYIVTLSWTELEDRIKALVQTGAFPVPETIKAKKEEPQSLINVLVVEPEKKPYLIAIPRGINALQDKVGGLITTIEIEDGIDAICADDADFETTPINRMINGQPIFGTFVLARVDHKTGKYESLKKYDVPKYMAKFAVPLMDITQLVSEYEELDNTQEDAGPDLEVTGTHTWQSVKSQPPYGENQQMTLFDMGVTPKAKEAELIEYVLLEGSLVEGGKQRIFDFAMTNPTGSAFEKMVKNEYGIGGHTINRHGIHFENHDGKGIVFDWTDDKGEKHETKITWLWAAVGIKRLINQGRYLENTNPIRTFDIEKPQESKEINSNIPTKIQVQIKETHLDYHNGQHDFLYEAIYNGVTIGVLQYSDYEDVPHVSIIEVLGDYRRRGVATQLLQALQGKYPDKEIEWGMLTEDGAALKAAVTFEVEDETYTELQKEHNRIAGQLLELEAKWRDKQVPDEITDYWNSLNDRQQDIEEVLYDKKPFKSFVRMPGISQIESKSADAGQKQAETAVEPANPNTVRTNFRYSEAYNLYPGGEKTKYKNNVEAIKLLKKIENEKRLATPDEQIVLARYVGWGGLANAFSDTAGGWEKEYHELKHLLDEKEYADALNSVVTAYYTEPELIRRIYKTIESFGFTGGEGRKILDPAMGTGNYFSVLPQSYEGTSLYGVELDSITGRIARQLYQKADIQVQGFETTRFEDNSFDIAIGNIPFNNIKLYDKRYDKEDFLIHDYFIGATR